MNERKERDLVLVPQRIGMLLSYSVNGKVSQIIVEYAGEENDRGVDERFQRAVCDRDTTNGV
jgi:hypothetical protein